MLKLFYDKQRSYMGYYHPPEPLYEYLDRSARPEAEKIRDMLELWYSRYPEGKDKKDLGQRFRSSIEVHHDAAFFELLIHETLLKLGCQPEPHPELSGKSTHPEFFVRSPRGDFFLEALVVRDETDEEAAARHRWERTLQAINSIPCKDFALDLTQEGLPKSEVPLSDWKLKIKDLLKKYEREQVLVIPHEERPKVDLEHDGLKATFRLIPKNTPTDETGNLIWGTLGPGEFIGTFEAIEKKMEKKAGKYGCMEIPFVLAVNVKKRWPMQNQFMNALFGEEGLRYYRNRKTGDGLGTHLVRTGGGVWMHEDGRPRNQKVSAAIFFENVHETNVPYAKGTLFHHPWAASPYKSELTVFPQMIPNAKGAYDEISGQGLETLYGDFVEKEGPQYFDFKMGDSISKEQEENL